MTTKTMMMSRSVIPIVAEQTRLALAVVCLDRVRCAPRWEAISRLRPAPHPEEPFSGQTAPLLQRDPQTHLAVHALRLPSAAGAQSPIPGPCLHRGLAQAQAGQNRPPARCRLHALPQRMGRVAGVTRVTILVRVEAAIFHHGQPQPLAIISLFHGHRLVHPRTAAMTAAIQARCVLWATTIGVTGRQILVGQAAAVRSVRTANHRRLARLRTTNAIRGPRPL